MISKDYQKIESKQNNQIKLLKKLQIKKYRQNLSLFTVENLTIISDGLKDGYDFEALFVTTEFNYKNKEKLKTIENKTKAKNFYLVADQLNKEYSNLDTPSGICAIYKIKTRRLDTSSVVYLNGINDPGNLGTIMRSALAFNFSNLVLDSNCVDIHNFKVINAAKDAIFKLNIFEDERGKWLKGNKLPVYTTSSHTGVNLEKFKAAKYFCLILGSETRGVDPELADSSNKSLKIEISPKIESLNVATAAAILFYELRRK